MAKDRFPEYTEGLPKIAKHDASLAALLDNAAESIHNRDANAEFLFEPINLGRGVRVGLLCSSGEVARVAESEFKLKTESLGYTQSTGSFVGNGGIVYYEKPVVGKAA